MPWYVPCPDAALVADGSKRFWMKIALVDRTFATGLAKAHLAMYILPLPPPMALGTIPPDAAEAHSNEDEDEKADLVEDLSGNG